LQAKTARFGGVISIETLDWMALWPLIAIALHRQNSSAAIAFGRRGLLAENQHPLP
jgi:hypothetical protein